MNLALVLSYIAVVIMLIATPGPVVALVISGAAVLEAETLRWIRIAG